MPLSADVELRALEVPIVQAPLAGGPSTPRLAAAVAGAGGFGFLAAGYKIPDALAAEIAELRELSSAPFGVNIFAPPPPAADVDAAAVARYAARLTADARRYGASVGEARHDDDFFAAKVELVHRERPAVVSFTFGCPAQEAVEALHRSGVDVWVTITTAGEAELAAAGGADALVVQGLEAGGHRGGFTDPPSGEELSLLVLLRKVANRVRLPLIAAGGIADGASIAAVLAAGAAAAQLGTALMLAPEAGTSAPHRAALARPGETALTRAFSGRTARGIVNRFMREHDREAPAAYPDVHHLTSPIRAASRAAGDPESINLWAGQAHELAVAEPAAEIVRRLWAETEASLAAAQARLNPASG
jgi:nitronate monooxygenase